MRYPEKHRSSALYQQVHSHLGETIVFQRPRDVEIKEAQFEMKLAVLSDFDGTVTLNDTFQNVLEKFGQATGEPLTISTSKEKSHSRNASEDRVGW